MWVTEYERGKWQAESDFWAYTPRVLVENARKRLDKAVTTGENADAARGYADTVLRQLEVGAL